MTKLKPAIVAAALIGLGMIGASPPAHAQQSVDPYAEAAAKAQLRSQAIAAERKNPAAAQVYERLESQETLLVGVCTQIEDWYETPAGRRFSEDGDRVVAWVTKQGFSIEDHMTMGVYGTWFVQPRLGDFLARFGGRDLAACERASQEFHAAVATLH